MSYDCGACLAKYVLCLFNFVLFLLGASVLGVGIWVATDVSSFISLTHTIENAQGQKLPPLTAPEFVQESAYILIAAGAFVFLISFLGYCGALQESRCLLTTYGILLILILVLEIVAGGLAAAYKGEAAVETKKFLKTTLEKYYTTNKDEERSVTFMWNQVMAQLHCCGVDGGQDFRNSKWTSGNERVPAACCKLKDKVLLEPQDDSCVYNPTQANSYYDKGCYEAFMTMIEKNMNIVIGIGIGLGVVQLVAVFLAFCLVKSINGYFK